MLHVLFLDLQPMSGVLIKLYTIFDGLAVIVPPTPYPVKIGWEPAPHTWRFVGQLVLDYTLIIRAQYKIVELLYFTGIWKPPELYACFNTAWHLAHVGRWLFHYPFAYGFLKFPNPDHIQRAIDEWHNAVVFQQAVGQLAVKDQLYMLQYLDYIAYETHQGTATLLQMCYPDQIRNLRSLSSQSAGLYWELATSAVHSDIPLPLLQFRAADYALKTYYASTDAWPVVQDLLALKAKQAELAQHPQLRLGLRDYERFEAIWDRLHQALANADYTPQERVVFQKLAAESFKLFNEFITYPQSPSVLHSLGPQLQIQYLQFEKAGVELPPLPMAQAWVITMPK
jgi:hypothetical protein